MKALVKHFTDMAGDKREMPVLWHQALLVFVQRYKAQLQPAQKEGLKAVMRVHSHYQITPEIRRELFSAAPKQTEEREGMEM